MREQLLIAGGCALLLCASAARLLAQPPPEEESEPPRVRPGANVRAVSAYAMGLSASSLEGPGFQEPQCRLGAGGASLEVGWRVAGRTGNSLLTYASSYDWNSRQPEWNGFDHAVRWTVRQGQGGRARVSFDASAEQRRWSTTLFEPFGAVTLARSQAFPALRDSLEEIRAAGTPGGPALDLWLFGRRVRRAAGRGAVTLAQSRRATWYGFVGGERIAPAAEAGSDLPARTMARGVTTGNTGGGLQFAVDRRTSVGVSAGYGRTYTGLLQTWSADGGLTLTHFLNERFFLYLAGGYGTMREILAEPLPPARSYQASGGWGGVRGAHTVTILAQRGLSARYGVAGLRSIAGETAWRWRPRNGGWGLSSSLSYQRLAGANLTSLQGWTTQWGVTRALTRETGVHLAAVCAGLSGRLAGPLSASVVAVRISLFWNPADIFS